MATWARGVDFKNSTNTTRVGGIGVYGTDATTNKLYIGLGAEPWNNAGLQLTSSAINFKGSKIYHAGDKPTLSELGAAAASHSHSYLPLSGGTVTSSSFGPLVIKRSGSTNASTIVFSNDNGTLGSIGMSSSKNGGLIRWTDDTTSNYTILDTGNYKSFVTPASIGALASGGTAVNSSKLNNKAESTAATANTIASRDSAGDITARLLRTSYADQSNISGAIAFRINNSTDNYTRYCNSPSAVRGWLGALALSGGTMTGALSSSVTTGTHIAGNKGTAIINSTAAGSSYNMLAKMNSTNGAWTMGSWGTNFCLFYTANSLITAGNNSFTKQLTLLNESGNTSFPGTVSAGSFSGSLSGNATTATTLQNARTLTIGRTGKSFNGAGNVSWSTDEIGALDKYNDSTLASGKKILLGYASSWLTGDSSAGTATLRAGGNLFIHGDADNSSTGEYVSIKAGNNDLRVISSAASTGQDKLTFNGNIVYHAGRKPTVSEIGAAAASHSHNNLAIKGTNTITTISNDTTANWGSHGNSVHWYTVAGQLNNQPAQYGYILNIGHASEVHQLWMTQSSGNLAHRGGNSSGWNGTWRTILDSSNYTSYAAPASHTHNYAGSSSAGGSANSAVKLATIRTINGTNFDGTASITTAVWGNTRVLQIGNTGKNVNGGSNVTWSLSEIGAAAASHSHSNYVSTSGGQQINGDLSFIKKLRLYENSAISFMLDAGQTYLESGSLYSDKNGGMTFLTGRGIETSLNNSAYFEGINGFTKNFEILTTTSPSITLTPFTNPRDNTGGRIIFNSTDNQNVQLRHEWYDGVLAPFGLIIEKAPGNTQKHNACLKVEGAIQCGVNASFINNTNSPDARIVRGETDNAGGLKVQMGGTNTTASFEVVNPGWNTAWFSCGNTGIRSNSYSNFSDEKLKTNIEEVNYSISDKMNKIKIYNYNYLSDYNRVIPSIVKRDIKCKTTAITKLRKANNYKISLSSKTDELYEDVPEKRWGVIAQEVEELFPELITEAETLIDGENKLVKSVDVYGLTVLTLEFAKEIAKENQTLKEELKLIKEKLGL